MIEDSLTRRQIVRVIVCERRVRSMLELARQTKRGKVNGWTDLS